MYRKKCGICRVQNYLHFQASTEDLTMHPLWVRTDYCAQTQEVQCRGRADGVYRWTRAEMKGEESTMNSRFQSEWLDRCQSHLLIWGRLGFIWKQIVLWWPHSVRDI